MGKIKRKSRRLKGYSSDQFSLPRQLITTPGAIGANFDTEQLFRVMDQISKQKGFASRAELDAFMEEKVMHRPLDELMAEQPPDPVEQAQALAFKAMEKKVPNQSLALTRKALEFDPNCVDAERIAALMESSSVEERVKAIGSLVDKAEQAFGRDYFRENAGSFWGLVETRPYMRTLAVLADLLLKAGQTAQAISQIEKMMRLNDHDNQGMRYILIGLYLEESRLKDARKLFKDFPEDGMAAFLWGRALERFLSRDFLQARVAFYRANTRNPYVLEFLTGLSPVPEEMPDYYEIGQTSEAMVCFHHLGKAFQKVPEAIEWLKSLGQ